MSPKLKEFLWRWLKNVLGVALAAEMVRGIHFYRLVDLLMGTFLLSVLHYFVRPPLKAFLRILNFMTLGLLTLVINAGMLLLVGWMLGANFYVAGFWSAFWGGIIVMIVSGMVFVFEKLFFGVKVVQTFRQSAAPPPPRPRAPAGPPPGTGPIIDV
ncbi:MAG TPA: phage holin family protein [Verrucomicrobiae bacterium]|jgi:putative membrane protein|nr:phage holin family protein [Verrucomicrobiae bacterium]